MPTKTGAPFRIALVGGGIGGLFAALAIHHHCSTAASIDVYEQAPQYKEIGARVRIGVNAAKLLDKIGLLDEALAIAGLRQPGIWLSFRRYDNGEEIIAISIKETEKVRQLPMQRAEFLELLYRAIGKRGAARLHMNKACRKLEDHGESMRISFADGTTATADLVIGADGIHSNVRSHYINDDAQYSGKLVYRGLCPIDNLSDWWPYETYGVTWLAKNKHFLTFPISRNRTLNIVGFVSAREEDLKDVKESWTLAGDKATVREEFKDFDSTVRRVIEYMDTSPQKWLLFDRMPLKEWSFFWETLRMRCFHIKVRQGAGAGQAIEDGYILGRILQDFLSSRSSKGRSLEGWLHVYQSVRLPRAEKVQVTSRESGEIYEMETEELRGLSYDESLPAVKKLLTDRMSWIWTEDIDVAYEKARG